MNELLKIEINENQEQTVSGRELHMFLGIETPYKKWFDRMSEYGFAENADYLTVDKNVYGQNGQLMPQKQYDHIMKLDMAKELCMLARNEKGKQARQYFIEVERDWNRPEKVMARALKLAEIELKKAHAFVAEQTKLLEAFKPKAIFADAVAASNNTILIGDLAKLLKQNGHETGQKRLFEYLRDNGYLIKRKGSDYNSPTQRAMEMKLFEIKETTVVLPDGSVKTNKTTKVTGKGQIYFINLFKKKQEASEQGA